MLKRIRIYLKEMFPVLPRLLVGAIIFFEIYFVLLLNYRYTNFKIGIQELIGALTVTAFLLVLRIADDFKDAETDKKLFPERPLPSGRVHKKDLSYLLGGVVLLLLLGNILFMNNLFWFFVLFIYGVLMSLWFFQRDKIQNNLLLAVTTHNPVMMVLNIYIISFTVKKYGLPGLTLTTVLLAFTLYFPSLIWEVARKIRSPREETEYVTYSRIYGHKKAARFVQVLTLLDIGTNLYLVYAINRPAIILLSANALWMTWKFQQFIKDPDQFRLIDKVERYTIITESLMIISVVIYLTAGYY